MSDPGTSAGEESDEPALLDLLLAAAFARGAGDADRTPATEVQAGSEVAGFRVLSHLGSGGMGTVYIAEQAHPRRRVALKLLAPTGNSRAMVRRFQQEAQLLGSLQHPGIAQIYGAGTVEIEGLGVPLHYLALELVEGPRLEDWIEQRGLPLRARLELMARICDAVEHAHQRGIVHRDLKPANILVVEDGLGGPGQPKVLDFGVARALAVEAPDRARTRVTLHGQLVGTLAYMSPEQAAGDHAAIDPRSDVYALGVLLYRMLCAAPPVEVAGLPLDEATRRIREHAPARPSRRVRGNPPELDLVVLKALAKSKDERYGSAAELAGDLRRFLRREPLLAREHSALYLLAKALRRNRLLVASVVGVVLLTTTFALVAGLQARRNRSLAEAVGGTRDDLARELRRSNVDRGRLFAMAGHLQVAEELLWGELSRTPDSDEALWGLRDLYRRFPCLSTHAVPTTSIYDILALPDGRLVSLGIDGQLREHRPPDFAPRAAGPPGKHGLQRLKLTPGGDLLVRLDDRRTLTAIDPFELEPRFTVSLGGGTPSADEGNALECPGDGRAWVGLDDGRLLEVELRAGGALYERALFPDPVRDLRSSPSGRNLAIGFADGSVCLMDTTDGSHKWTAPGSGRAGYRMEFDPTEERLFVGGLDRRVRVFSCADGSLLEQWSAPNGTVRQIQLDPALGRALVGGWWSLDEWSLTGAGRRVRLRHPTPCFLQVPGSDVLVTWDNRAFRTWDGRLLQDPAPLLTAEDRAVARFLDGGRLAAVGDGAGRVTLLETAGGASRWSTATLDRPIRAITANADETRLIVAGVGGDLVMLHVESGRVLERLGPARVLAQTGLALHPKGALLAYSDDGAGLVVRDIERGELAIRAQLDGEIGGIAWSPHGETLAVIDRRRGLLLVDVAGGVRFARETQESLWGLRYSPDGRHLVASAWGGALLLFDGRTLEPSSILEGHSATVWDLAFRGTEPAHLLSASGDGTLRLWDLDERRCLLVLDELDGWEALSVDVAADGRRLLLASSTGDVHAIDLFGSDRCITGNLPFQARRLERAALLPGGVDPFVGVVRMALETTGNR